MLVAEEQVTESDDNAAGSPERFGYEWTKYSTIKIEYREQFLRWLPFFQPEDWRGKTFLDVGCGMGRNSYWALQFGARSGLAVDVDDRTLASAHATLSTFPNARVTKCSAYDVGSLGSFDITFSVGVIHHLEHPDRALKAMFHSTAHGGHMAIWVYGRENNEWLLWLLNPARRLLFSRMPIGLVHGLSILPTSLLWCALRLGVGRIEYFRLLRTFDFAHLRSIVFDQMLPRIARYWRREEVEQMMRDVGLEQVELQWVNQMSWAARGRKPASMGGDVLSQ